MFRHLFKLIWNKKGTHSLLIVEIWASFLVIFGVLSLIVYNVRNYLLPIGFEYSQVWNLELSSNQDTTDIAGKLQRVMQRVSSYREIEASSRMSSNTPFSANQIGNAVTYNKVSVGGDFYYTDPNIGEVLNLPVSRGRWYREADMVGRFTPIVINKKMSDRLFGDAEPVGKIIKFDDKKSYRVTGVVERFKGKGEFMDDGPGLFEMISKDDRWNSNILIRTRPGTDANFEARLVKEIAAMLPGWGIEVSYLTDSHKNRNNLTMVPVIIFLIISGFLLTNVALGLFGILNLNIAKRKGEIGLRRAMGATEGRVTLQFLGEIWVIATFALILWLIFAVQFPIMNVFDLESTVYIIAILAAIAIIYIIVTLCAWFPSKQAALVHPAVALHEE